MATTSNTHPAARLVIATVLRERSGRWWEYVSRTYKELARNYQQIHQPLTNLVDNRGGWGHRPPLSVTPRLQVRPPSLWDNTRSRGDACFLASPLACYPTTHAATFYASLGMQPCLAPLCRESSSNSFRPRVGDSADRDVPPTEDAAHPARSARLWNCWSDATCSA
jgi:hypothetical protein